MIKTITTALLTTALTAGAASASMIGYYDGEHASGLDTLVVLYDTPADPSLCPGIPSPAVAETYVGRNGRYDERPYAVGCWNAGQYRVWIHGVTQAGEAHRDDMPLHKIHQTFRFNEWETATPQTWERLPENATRIHAVDYMGETVALMLTNQKCDDGTNIAKLFEAGPDGMPLGQGCWHDFGDDIRFHIVMDNGERWFNQFASEAFIDAGEYLSAFNQPQ